MHLTPSQQQSNVVLAGVHITTQVVSCCLGFLNNVLPGFPNWVSRCGVWIDLNHHAEELVDIFECEFLMLLTLLGHQSGSQQL